MSLYVKGSMRKGIVNVACLDDEDFDLEPEKIYDDDQEEPILCKKAFSKVIFEVDCVRDVCLKNRYHGKCIVVLFCSTRTVSYASGDILCHLRTKMWCRGKKSLKTILQLLGLTLSRLQKWYTRWLAEYGIVSALRHKEKFMLGASTIKANQVSVIPKAR